MIGGRQHDAVAAPKFFHVDDAKLLREKWANLKDPEQFCHTLFSYGNLPSSSPGVDVNATALYRALMYFFRTDDGSEDDNNNNNNKLKSSPLTFEKWLFRVIDSAARLLTVARMQPPQILFPTNPEQFQGTRAFCHSILANALLGNLAHDPILSDKQRSSLQQQQRITSFIEAGNGLLDWRLQLFPAITDVAYNKVLCLLQYFVTTASMHSENDDDDDDDDCDDPNRRFWEETITFQRISNFEPSEFESLVAWDHVRIRSSAWRNQDKNVEEEHSSTQNHVPQHDTRNVLYSITTLPMEDYHCSAMVDFANEIFGVGGFDAQSATQEEIIQVTCPEFNVGMMCFGRLPQHGVLIVQNVRRYSQYLGYGESFTYHGPLADAFAQTFIVMDAINLNDINLDCNDNNLDASHKTSESNEGCDDQHRKLFDNHFSRNLVMRDLQKAYMGFIGAAVADLSSPSLSSSLSRSRPPLSQSGEVDNSPTAYIISTGKWGCGAFGGNVYLKFLLQVVAAYLCCGSSSESSTLPTLKSSKEYLTTTAASSREQQDCQNNKDDIDSGNDDDDDELDPYVCLRFSAYRNPDLQLTLEQLYRACHGLTPRQILQDVLTNQRCNNTALFVSAQDGPMTLDVDGLINLLQSLPRH